MSPHGSQEKGLKPEKIITSFLGLPMIGSYLFVCYVMHPPPGKRNLNVYT